MPLFQYFGWVGGFLLAALLAVNWCTSAPIAPSPRSDVPLNQRINVRIHTDHKWPERVVFDTARSLLPQRDGGQSDIAGIGAPAFAQRQPFDAFAKMAATPARPCFRSPCSRDQAQARKASSAEASELIQDRSRLSTAGRNSLTFPNLPHRPPGKS